MKSKAKSASVGDIVRLMESWAPSWTAESWDRVGLMTGDLKAPAEKIWVALELSPELLEEALTAGAQMILSHHPPIFNPLPNLRTDNPATDRLVRAAAAGLALFAAHTNLDAAPGGVNDALADALGLKEVEVLKPAGSGLAKLVTFVPPDHLPQVSQALFKAGAGRIGEYRECSFYAGGTGSFWAPDGGQPFVGSPGQKEQVDEQRLETIISLNQAGEAIKALIGAHPYEEPAVDLYPLQQGPAGVGLGRVGNLPQPLAAMDFAVQAARSLGAAAPQMAGPLPGEVRRVAVVGGSGGDLLSEAVSAGAQVLVTGEAGYHQGEQARDLGLCLITLGHYQTEAMIIDPWTERLRRMLEREGLTSQVRPWTQGGGLWRAVLGE
ncbi:MAG: Nif3-like dinuclear metal center hexameric protein [Desulfarculaceae bacterium]|jgi:dinuclear metal center YbgI/SA1388 family protein